MAQLLVRKLDEDVKRRLGERASRHGHSMEQEVRNILLAAVASEASAPEGLGTRIARRFAVFGLLPDEELPEIHGTPTPANFDE